jgi:hypothetical protein
MTKSAIGFSYLKRKIAFQFGVDPYSSNPTLQDELNELTWIAFSADLAPQFGYLFMPGGAILWMTFSATRWTSYLDEQVRDHSASDLRAMDRAKLLNMAISEEDIHRFFLNSLYSPRHSTIITTALDELTGVDGREALPVEALDLAREAFDRPVLPVRAADLVHVGEVAGVIAMAIVHATPIASAMDLGARYVLQPGGT